MWYSKAGKYLSDQGIVAEEGDGLGEDGVVMIEGGGNDLFVENRIGQNIDKEDLLLSIRETEKVDGDFIGGSVQDRGHIGDGRRTCLSEHLISSTSWSYLCCFQTASTCPSNLGRCSVVPTQ